MTAHVAMDFGAALQALKEGKHISRRGWNGKDMYLYLVKGQVYGHMLGFSDGAQLTYPHPSTIDGISLGLFTAIDSRSNTLLPCIAMKTAAGSVLHGWLASQTDMFAEDWGIVE